MAQFGIVIFLSQIRKISRTLKNAPYVDKVLSITEVKSTSNDKDIIEGQSHCSGRCENFQDRQRWIQYEQVQKPMT